MQLKIENSPRSFGAKYLTAAKIKKIMPDNKYIDKEVSFVELNPGKYADMLAIKETSMMWGPKSFAADIGTDALLIHNTLENHGRKFYAVTLQKTDFNTPNPDDILALSEVTKSPGKAFIEFIQVNPDFIDTIELPVFKKIGTAVLKSFEKIFKNRTIELESIPRAETFYELNGYTKVYKYENLYRKKV